jgi:TolA-binding protein
MEDKMRRTVLIALMLLFSRSAYAQDADFTPRDAADGVFGRAGDLSGTPAERGQRIHDATVDQQMQRIQNNQGDAAMLREQQNYSRQHNSGYPSGK